MYVFMNVVDECMLMSVCMSVVGKACRFRLLLPVCMYECMYVCLYVCMYVYCMYVCKKVRHGDAQVQREERGDLEMKTFRERRFRDLETERFRKMYTYVGSMQ